MSRIFLPEASAASFRLSALARALVSAGIDVSVFTVLPPKTLAVDAKQTAEHYKVRRFPVLRNKEEYVRGYMQYLSFDLPLFFRILFAPRRDLIVVEPPPTTGFFASMAAKFRGTPYAYYAADIWSDASSQTGAPKWILCTLRATEKYVLKRAAVVLSVSSGVTRRLAELGIETNVVTVGNGVPVEEFETGEGYKASHPSTFVYAGTASELHGAAIFIQALPAVLAEFPEVNLRFIGGGSEPRQLKRLAHELGIEHAVRFDSVMQAADVAPILACSAAALASVKPGSGYDFAFPTKLYSAAVCGAPLIFAGNEGPGADFVRTEVHGTSIGDACRFDPTDVSISMLRVLRDAPSAERRADVASWAKETVGLRAVAQRVVGVLDEVVCSTGGNA